MYRSREHGVAGQGMAERGQRALWTAGEKMDCVAERTTRHAEAKTFLLRVRGQTYEILVTDAVTLRASAIAVMPSAV